MAILLFAENHKVNTQKNTTKFSEENYSTIKWQNIGPFRGGRSGAVTGVPEKENLFYMGSTDCGVLKTTGAGNSWSNISENKGLPKRLWGISSVTVSPVNSDFVWLLVENKDGGIYKSEDGGKTSN